MAETAGATEPVLCYIEDTAAYFTTDPENEIGDDWDDAPYQHNAGPPYGKGEITTIHFDCTRYLTPGEDYGTRLSFSVDDINAKKVPWLRTWPNPTAHPPIWAGTTLSEFKRMIWAEGGRIYELVTAAGVTMEFEEVT